MDIPAILTSKFSNAEWTMNGDDYEGLTWLSESKKPSLKELENFWPEIEAELQVKSNAIVSARESALAKLAALGLTADEIASL